MRIEFEKGKAAVGPLEKLPGVIDALIKAVRVGELGRAVEIKLASCGALPEGRHNRSAPSFIGAALQTKTTL